MKTAIVVLLVILTAVSIYSLTMDKIDLTEYETSIDYGSLTAEQIEVMDTILRCSANTIEQKLTYDEFNEVIDHIGLYFGTNLAHMNVALWRPGYAEVNTELLRSLESDKAVLDTKIDNAVSKMYEGSDRFKLQQISDYIAKTVKYSCSIDDIEPLSGLAGKGSCMTYSMLFYKMATRVGIQAYICYGDADGKPHAWNMAIIDGEQYFYDVTWYDNVVPDLRYIYSRTAWGRLPHVKGG